MKRIFLLTTLYIIASLTVSATDIDRMALMGKRISSADGLSSNTVYDIVQDKYGFVWMGAAYGLCRYDGYSFVNFYSLSDEKSKKIEANVGNLYEDRANSLLWIHTATFNFACYDMSTGRFVDYTGRDDESKAYRRMLRSGNNMWMYDTSNGMRRVEYRGGKFTCDDYTAENGKLPSNHIPRIVEDGRQNVWILTYKGLAVADKEGRIKTVVRGVRYIEGCSYNGKAVVLTGRNTVEVYEPTGKRSKVIQIPAALGPLHTIRSSFVWQDKWMLFGPETFSVDLRSGLCEKPEGLQLHNGLLLESIDGFFFESNAIGDLWIFSPKGEVRKFRLIDSALFTAERRRLYSVARGKDGLFYIATYGNGLFVYDFAANRMRHFTANDPQPIIDTDVLKDITVGNDGTVWVAQENAGVARITVTPQPIASFIQPMPGHNGDWSNYIGMVAEGKEGEVVFSTRDNRLYSLDTASGQVKETGRTKSCVFSVLTDRHGRVWMATRNDGLYIDGKHYDKGKDGKGLPSRMLNSMVEDAQGRVWIGTTEEGLIMASDMADGSVAFHAFLNRNLNESRLHKLDIDRKGRLWVATNNGLYVVETRKKRITNDDFKCFNPSNSAFPYSEVRCVLPASDGALWAGGKGSGVVRCTFDANLQHISCKSLTKEQGMANNTVNSMAEDRYKNLWVATENGLSVIYGKDFKVKTYLFGNSFGRNTYSENAVLRMDDGRLILGTQAGIAVITPQQLSSHASNRPIDILITDISVNGSTSPESNPAGFAPGNTSSITLSHNENSVSLSFSNFEYGNTKSSLYQFYMEGSDRTWRPLTSMNHVEYGNLTPGHYVFHLRSLSDNRWSKETTLAITIRQPWYNTLWAWLVYVALAATAGLYLYSNAREKFRLHQQMRINKELTEFRLSFFTSITHEFRTPLAIIQGAVDKLMAGKGEPSRAALQTVGRGTHRLLRLVNQLMEFRKVTTDNMKIRVEQGDIVNFVRDIYQDLWNIAKTKSISITFTPFERHYEMPFDRSMVESMVYNLISNAVKYTPERGTISVSLKKIGNQIVLTVADNGPGIGKEQLKSLFQPFMHGNVSQGGMGIGLYTAHRMAELHHGSLTYKPGNEDINQANNGDDIGSNGGDIGSKNGAKATGNGGDIGNGSGAKAAGNEGNTGAVFILTLPSSADAYTKDEFKKTTAIDTETDEAERKGSELPIKELLPEALNDVTVAVIEDDYDMSAQICGELATYFHVESYTTGESGLAGVREKKPVLVICDVMLPGMNGYDVVKQLKSDAATAMTPVIMLTALDDENHQMRSYNAGADDYMVKPCNFKLLLARSLQLIRQAQSHKAELAQSSKAELPTKQDAQGNAPCPTDNQADTRLITTQADKVFREKVQYIMAQHLSDPNFTVDQLAAMVGMGRTKFFKKMKDMTGMSPNKYLQNERMRIAADLLADGELTVSEVSYKVGIQDASYFNKCFKQKFGVVPSKYKREC